MRALVLAGVLAIGAAIAAPAIARAEPPTSHEILSDRPSGFWTSNAPAVNGAYRYRLLLVGIAVALGTGLGMARLLKRASAEPRPDLVRQK